MRITNISVKGLFGMFDHEIPLNQESRITIVHGPNGVGKTVLLRMLHGLFNFDYAYIASIPFEMFRIEYEDGAILTVEKPVRADEEDDRPKLLIGFVNENGKQAIPYTPTILSNYELLKIVSERMPEFTPIYIEARGFYWTEENKQGEHFGHSMPRAYSKDDLLLRDPPLRDELYGSRPNWFENIKGITDVSLISTMRLQSEIDSLGQERIVLFGDMMRQEVESAKFIPSPTKAVNRLWTLIDPSRYDDYRNLQLRIEELDQSLNDNVIKGSVTIKKAVGELKEALESELSDEYSDVKYRINLADRYCELVNERLLYKSMELFEEYTYLKSDRGIDVPLSALSSGEQHLLVLYFQLLFEIEPDTLVMIDEPELSMNVVWQRNFLKDLQRIVELREFDVLIATHSPMIIHDKWDWVVHLGEKVDD